MILLVAYTLFVVSTVLSQEITAAPKAASAAPSAQIKGRVVEQDTRSPVANAQVTLMGPIGMPRRAVPDVQVAPSATTDEQGRFEFDNVPHGLYRLVAQKAGFAIPFNLRPQHMHVVEVPEASSASVVQELAIQRGAVIIGRVIDAVGRPVADAHVTAMEPGRITFVEGPLRAVTAAGLPLLVQAGPGVQTNDLGEFLVDSLPSGEYVVQASPRTSLGGTNAAVDGMAMVTTFYPGATNAEEAQTVAVTAGQTVHEITIRLQEEPVYPVSGVVVDGTTGDPIPDALVRLAPDAPSILLPTVSTVLGRSDATGAFLFPSVRRGSYTVIAAAPVMVAHGSAEPSGMRRTGSMSFVAHGGHAIAGPSTTTTTEARNGKIFRYDDAAGSRESISVEGMPVVGLRLVVR